MYLIQFEVRESLIHGKGVFAVETIPKNTIVWKFIPTHDQTLSNEDFNALGPEAKAELSPVAYWSARTQRWVFPPPDDPARFTNHSDSSNLSVVFDATVSEEPYFVANRDIKSGEEITVNYTEFDARAGGAKEWEQNSDADALANEAMDRGV